MKSEFLISGIEAGQLNAMVKNIMSQTGVTDPQEVVRIVNSGEARTSVRKRWGERNGLIYFSVTSDGTTGKRWVRRLEKKGFEVGEYAKSVLLSKDFKPGNPTTYEVVVLKGELFINSDRTTKNMRNEAKTRKLSSPNAEVACLIREKFSNSELMTMGLYWIVTMHEPINDMSNNPVLLCVEGVNDNSRISAHHDSLKHRWYRVDGFAFVVSQFPNF